MSLTATTPDSSTDYDAAMREIDSATAEQRAKYTAYVDALAARLGIPQGPGKLLFAQDVVSTS